MGRARGQPSGAGGSGARDPATTARMLAGVRGGEPAALESLFARHHGRLRIYVRGRLGSALARRLEVDDVVQETWLRALPALPGRDFAGDSDAFRFLAAVARHVLLDAARAARTLKRAHRAQPLARSDWTRAGTADPVDPAPGPATRAALGEEARRLEEAFARLSAADRRVIALRQFEQLPAREVARRLGSSEGAVHARYRRALSRWATG